MGCTNHGARICVFIPNDFEDLIRLWNLTMKLHWFMINQDRGGSCRSLPPLLLFGNSAIWAKNFFLEPDSILAVCNGVFNIRRAFHPRTPACGGKRTPDLT